MHPSELTGKTLDQIRLPVLQRQRRVLERAEAYWRRLRPAHPVYSHGWGQSVVHPHRYMNLIVASLLRGYPGVVLDFGAYDGALVALLVAEGVNAYGYEPIPWSELYGEMGVSGRINSMPSYGDTHVARPCVEVAVALNVLHQWTPEDALLHITDACGGDVPQCILADWEERTPHANNALWVDPPGWVRYRFPAIEASGNADLQRMLLVWGRAPWEGGQCTKR